MGNAFRKNRLAPNDRRLPGRHSRRFETEVPDVEIINGLWNEETVN